MPRICLLLIIVGTCICSNIPQLLLVRKYDQVVSECTRDLESRPEDCSLYYYRATAEWTLGRVDKALNDFGKCLELDPNYYVAYSGRGSVYLSLGSFDQAIRDFEQAVARNSQDQTRLTQARTLRDTFDSVHTLISQSKFEPAISKLKTLLNTCTYSGEICFMLAQCHAALGDTKAAIVYYEKTVSKVDDPSDIYLELAKFHFTLGNLTKGMEHLQHCIHYHPEHKTGVQLFKHIRELEKNYKKVCGDTEALESFYHEIETVDDPVYNAIKMEICLRLCELYAQKEQLDKVISWGEISKRLGSLNHRMFLILCETYIKDQDHESALELIDKYEKDIGVQKLDPTSQQEIDELRVKAQQKPSTNYYKILGVSRTASQKEIKNAFRKQALKYHPDRNKSPNASKRFQKISKAYETLQDPAKRREYDTYGSEASKREFGDYPGFTNVFQFGGPGQNVYDHLFRQFNVHFDL